MEVSPTDQGTAQGQERFVNVIAAFIANPQTTELVQPRHRPLHDPAIDAQATPVRHEAVGQHRLDMQGAQLTAQGLRIVAAIPLHALGAPTWTTAFAPHGGNRPDQRHQLCHIRDVGPGQEFREREATRIRKEVMFAARLGPISGIGTRFFPPCTARTEALSATARDQSI